MEHYCLFRAEDEDSREINQVARELHPVGGIIIVLLNKEGAYYYYSQSEVAVKFGDPTRSESPITYYRLSAAKKKLEKVRRDYWHFAGASLAMWVHPDAGMPLAKYMKMQGNRYPGSPRR